MGFNVTALAQKARTKTLIVDSDLNMEQYDVIATDVKGDTAEFSEFVGGVGNFESGLISGGLDVSGILHAESNLQVDGGISLEGSINNVNITSDGHINAPMVQTPILKLPVSTTGNFKIGEISMPTLSIYVSQFNLTDTRTFNFGVPTVISTIPSVFDAPTTPSTNTVSYDFGGYSRMRCDFYQNNELIYSGASTGSFELSDFEHEITVIWVLTGASFTYLNRTITISKATESYYLV